MSFLALSPDNLETLFRATCQATISAQVEDNLMAFREDPSYLVLLLDLIGTTQDAGVQLRAAIEFKNTVLLHWVRWSDRRPNKRKLASTTCMLRLPNASSPL